MYLYPIGLTVLMLVSRAWGQNGNFGMRQNVVSNSFGQFHPWEPSYKPEMDYTSNLLENHYKQLAQQQQQGLSPFGPGYVDDDHFGPGFTDQRINHPSLPKQPGHVMILPPTSRGHASFNGHIGGFGFGGSGFDAPGIQFGVHHASFYRPNVVSPMFLPYEKPSLMDKVGKFAKSDAGKAIGACMYRMFYHLFELCVFDLSIHLA